MIIDCISDLHGHYPKLEGGDLLIVAGDLTATDDFAEWIEFLFWLAMARYKKKIVISGNHGNRYTKNPPHKNTLGDNCFYLCDSGTEFVGLKIWGSPWTLGFKGMNPACMAFTCETEDELAEKWALIPDDVDILVTHSPPFGIFDAVRRYGPFSHEREELVGSKSLLIRVAEIKPLVHCFGHIHEKGGKDLIMPWKRSTTFVNACHVNERYEPVNKPIRIEL